MCVCVCVWPLRSLAVLYLLPSARRILSTTSHTVLLIINTPFLSWNPKKLCFDLRLGRPSALPAGQLPDKVTARRSRRGKRAAQNERPKTAQGTEKKKKNPTRSSEIGRCVRDDPLENPCNCWTGGTERLVQKKKKGLKCDRQTHGSESPKELQTHYIHTSDRPCGSMSAARAIAIEPPRKHQCSSV